MRWCRFANGSTQGVGYLIDDVLSEVDATFEQVVGGDVELSPVAEHRIDDVTLLAPVAESCRGMFAVGLNYRAHREETRANFAQDDPSHPIIFFKNRETIADPFAPLVLPPEISLEFDWEVELGVVIAKPGRNIPTDAVEEHIFGYCVVNDISARDLQRMTSQWHLGKNVERSSPVGPWIVPVDDIGYPPKTSLSLPVNGVEKQHAITEDLIFSIAEVVSLISKVTTLLPGDVISTGTPEGVGFARNPPEFLRDGDVLESEVAGIGTLRNSVVAEYAPLPVLI